MKKKNEKMKMKSHESKQKDKTGGNCMLVSNVY